MSDDAPRTSTRGLSPQLSNVALADVSGSRLATDFSDSEGANIIILGGPQGAIVKAQGGTANLDPSTHHTTQGRLRPVGRVSPEPASGSTLASAGQEAMQVAPAFATTDDFQEVLEQVVQALARLDIPNPAPADISLVSSNIEVLEHILITTIVESRYVQGWPPAA